MFSIHFCLLKDNNKRGAVNYEASQLISDPEYMRIALTVTKTILILGLVLLPQPMEALVLPFSKLNLDNNRSFFDRRSAAPGSTRSEPRLHIQDPPLVLKKTNLDHHHVSQFLFMTIFLSLSRLFHFHQSVT